MKRMWLILALVLVPLVPSTAQNPRNQGTDQGYQKKVLSYVIDPSAVVYSRTFSEWNAEWQQWVYSIPVATHPLFDYSEAKDCTVGQSGPMFFLGGRFCKSSEPGACFASPVERSCTVPKGKLIYVPIWNWEDSLLEQAQVENPGNPDAQQIGFMRQIVDPWKNYPSQVYAILDGVAVPNLDRYKVQSTVFTFTIPEDNLLNQVYPDKAPFLPGTYSPAVDMGQYLMLALPPGEHTLQFAAGWGGPPAADVKYTITIPQ